MPAHDFDLFTSLRYDPHLATGPPEVKGPAGAGWNRANPSSPLYMLDFHRDRMLRAARHWGWDAAVAAIDGDEGLARLEAFILGLPGLGDDGPRRVKVTLSKEGKFGHEVNPAKPRPLTKLFPARLPPPGAGDADDDEIADLEPALAVVPDLEKTARSAYTHYKTTERTMYDGARRRANIAPTDSREVLLVNEDAGTVMEGSMTTPYFWRSGRWVTPPVAPAFTNEVGSGGNDGTTRRWALERGICVEEAVPVASLVDGEECWLSNGVRGYMHCKVKLPEP